MRRSFVSRLSILVAVVVMMIAGGFQSAKAQMVHPANPSSQDLSIPKEQLLTPEDLVKTLQSTGPKPLILNIGPRMLYAQAHIPGAEFIGPGSDAQGIEALKQRVKGLPKTKSIVLYCGCCPWAHCPNVEPAFKELRSLGFTKVKVLFIATNLGVDWVYKGYPTEK
jgi:thiosulfate/3-mercaptopyruvate sulfurtransferase